MVNYTRRIRDLRTDAGLNQSTLAELLHVGQHAYSNYELGKTRLPTDNLLILAKFYNVSLDYISGASDIRKPFPTK